jgi:hypothetical protein
LYLPPASLRPYTIPWHKNAALPFTPLLQRSRIVSDHRGAQPAPPFRRFVTLTALLLYG